MISSSDINGVAEGNSDKPPMENGYCSSPGVSLKYKRRRVSAVRDFPPGCGREAPVINQVTQEAVTVRNEENLEVNGEKVSNTVEEAYCVNSSDDAAAHSGKEVNGSVQPEISGLLDDLVDRVMTSVGGAGVLSTNSDSLALALVPKALEDGVQEPVMESDGVEMEALGKSVDVTENKTMMEASALSPKVVSEAHAKSPSPLECPTSDGKALEGTAIKSKFTRRRVSAVRDFPPFCGRNAPCPTEEDRLRILGGETDRFVVQGLMAAPNCPWRLGKGALVTSKFGGSSGGKVKQRPLKNSKGISLKRKSLPTIWEDEGSVAESEEQPKKSDAVQTRQNFDVILPPFGPNSSSHGDVRNKVRETLRLFQAICRKLLQGEEAKLRKGEGGRLKQQDKKPNRIDLSAAKIIREKGKEINTGTQIIGAVPGVEVGDEFQFRVELALIGVHRLYQAGIDYIKKDGVIVATSIVASGGYHDDMDNADVLIYSGQGGIGRDKQPEDQKLERGNLALKNSISAENPVRVIRGSKETKSSESSNTRSKTSVTYTYDGLYTVKRYWQEPGSSGKLVFKFELRRNPGQPELAWKEVKKSKKFKVREGLCVDDISGGKEFFPICAVNTIDNEKPPSFHYITKIMYPDWYRPVPIQVCDCIGGCSDSQKCFCVIKNGGEIPYNHNGAIVEVKSLVYECGPSCKCPPSCYNRVSQHGIKKVQLEIFKTDSRGWGVRSLNSIPSGTFICEYVGEFLEDKEAEKRTGNDEYLFDIGQNYNDCSVIDGSSTLKPDDSGFTIDAAQYGNVGRFINHSCSPNMYAQNVLYDHDDKRMPHIMFFAAENIPPLHELTYHYNYTIDQVRDSNGNIRKKSCYCGAPDCTGRMY